MRKHRRSPRYTMSVLLLAALVASIWVLRWNKEVSGPPPQEQVPPIMEATPEVMGPAPAPSLSPKPIPWELILVNKWNPLPDQTEPQLAEMPGGKQVDARIKPSLSAMFADMEAEGIYPIVASGYRSTDDQTRIYDEKLAECLADGMTETEARTETEKWVAVPGTSEHQLGLGVDINADGIHSAGYEIYDWLAENAHRYGFIKRYPEGTADITGVENEPWHYRYVGVQAASEIYQQGVTLEEYLENIDQESEAAP